jgi:hypothetical protein
MKAISRSTGNRDFESEMSLFALFRAFIAVANAVKAVNEETCGEKG